MENYSHEQIQYEAETGMIYRIYHSDGFFNSNHWHNGLEIIYVISGKITLTSYDGEYTLLPGGFIVVNSKTIHSVLCRERTRHLLLQIPFDLLRKSVPDIDIITFNCACPSEASLTHDLKLIKDDLERLARLYEQPKDNCFLLLFNSIVYNMLYKLVKHFSVAVDPAAKQKTEKNIDRLGAVVQFVSNHYAENITLNDAAVTVALNREYFARFFKKYMGMTFMDYVYAVRLEHVYRDIKTTDLTIGCIAEKNGFGNNYKLFTQKFRKQYGCSPNEARNLFAHRQ